MDTLIAIVKWITGIVILLLGLAMCTSWGAPLEGDEVRPHQPGLEHGLVIVWQDDDGNDTSFTIGYGFGTVDDCNERKDAIMQTIKQRYIAVCLPVELIDSFMRTREES